MRRPFVRPATRSLTWTHVVATAVLLLVFVWGTEAAVAQTCTVGEGSRCGAGEFCTADWRNQKEGWVCPDQGSCRPLPEAPDLALTLPLPAGTQTYCAKGPLRPPPDTHGSCSVENRFSIDLASPATVPPRLVLAAADGTAYGFSGCPAPGDLNGGEITDGGCYRGFGNMVRIQHGQEHYSQYAHLSAVLVDWGESVSRGEPIGIEGNTGSAGLKHLHWSLHRGDARYLGEAQPSVPMSQIRTASGSRSMLELDCNGWTKGPRPTPESALVSQTLQKPTPKKHRWGVSGRPTRSRVARKLAVLPHRPSRRWAIAVLEQEAKDPESRYFLALAMRAEGKQDRAVELLDSLIDSSDDGPSWLEAWSRLHRARIAEARGEPERAETHLRWILEHAPDESSALRTKAREALDRLDRADR